MTLHEFIQGLLGLIFVVDFFIVVALAFHIIIHYSSKLLRASKFINKHRW